MQRPEDQADILGRPLQGRLIAQGTYADIVLTSDKSLSDGLIAIKVVSAPVDGKDDDRLPHNIVLEHKILQQCSHPSIIRPLHYSFEGETSLHRLYLPYIPFTLLDLFPIHHHDPTSRVHLFRSIAYQLLTALAYIHERGISHRDVNPKNVMITRTGQVQLIDFSTSFAPDIHSTEEKADNLFSQVGTGAPELLFGPETYDPQAIDLWATGVTLAELFEIQHQLDDTSPDDSPTSSSSVDPLEDPSTLIVQKGIRKRLFDSTFGDIGLAASIFRIRGSPKYTWLEFEDLPDSSKVFFEDFPPVPLADVIPSSVDLQGGEHMVGLIDGLLHLCPSRRITARDALELPLFDRSVLLPPGYPTSERHHSAQIDGMTLESILEPCVREMAEKTGISLDED